MALIITEVAIQADGTWAVEIHNTGPGSEDLSDYLVQSTSGGANGGLVSMSGTLPADGTYTIGHSSIPGLDQSNVDAAFANTPIQMVGLYFNNNPGFLLVDHMGENNGGTDLGTDVVFEGPTTRSPDSSSGNDNTGDFTQTADFDANNSLGTPCFLTGTMIATPDGERAVETLAAGDAVLTAQGHAVPVLWVGRKAVRRRIGTGGDHLEVVRIAAGALGAGLPTRDLFVTGDHGMVLDGLVINAAALVNHGSIDWVAPEEAYTVWHIETEAHDVILANGAATETFLDAAGRAAFDNHDEYLDLYGVERIIPDMPHVRVMSRRLLPQGIRARIGAVEQRQRKTA